jgi:hypothetical protein
MPSDILTEMLHLLFGIVFPPGPVPS